MSRVLLGFAAILAILLLDPGRTTLAAELVLTEELVDRVNNSRAEAGLPPLVQENPLDGLAAERSDDMAARHYFSHVTPDGVDVFTLMGWRGISYSIAGENLAWTTFDPDYAVAAVLEGFLDSPPHRANLLNPAFSQIGVGIAWEGDRLYFTLVFVG
jgi:uncharacterized protein YkwD